MATGQDAFAILGRRRESSFDPSYVKRDGPMRCDLPLKSSIRRRFSQTLHRGRTHLCHRNRAGAATVRCSGEDARRAGLVRIHEQRLLRGGARTHDAMRMRCRLGFEGARRRGLRWPLYGRFGTELASLMSSALTDKEVINPGYAHRRRHDCPGRWRPHHDPLAAPGGTATPS